jgi:hypothetical protein
MAKLQEQLRASPFASLLGAFRAQPATAETNATTARAEGGDDNDDERKKRDGESDEDYSKRMKALDEKEDGEARRAKAEEDDKKKDEEAKKAAAASAVGTERQRCAAIFAHALKLSSDAGDDLGVIAQACSDAFDSDKTADAAIASLNAKAQYGRTARTGRSLADRMSSEQSPAVTPLAEAPAAGSVEAIVAQARAVMDKVMGKA